MSLPEKMILAGPTTLPKISATESALGGVVDPEYLINLKQIPYLQLTRLFDQLTDFTGYANDMFFGLANESIRVSERIHGLQAKIDDLARRMPEFKNNLDSMQDLKAIGRERMAWKTQYLITSNLFTKATQPAEIVEAFENCPPIPPLDELDVFRADGQSSMKLFSYPDFFVEEWKILLSGNKKSKKQAARGAADLMVSEERTNESGHGGPNDQFLVNKPQKVQRERKRVEGLDTTHLSIYPNMPGGAGFYSQNPLSPGGLKSPFSQAPPTPKAAPPPPPPPGPPPPPNTTSPGIASASTLTSPKSVKSDDSADVDRGFLSDIKGNQFKLKKTEVQTREERKKANEPEGVAAILMRRAALQDDSGSDADGGEEDEWN